eukprot:6189051-Pleurochrysis_carterae.AAC.4
MKCSECVGRVRKVPRNVPGRGACASFLKLVGCPTVRRTRETENKPFWRFHGYQEGAGKSAPGSCQRFTTKRVRAH